MSIFDFFKKETYTKCEVFSCTLNSEKLYKVCDIGINPYFVTLCLNHFRKALNIDRVRAKDLTKTLLLTLENDSEKM